MLPHARCRAPPQRVHWLVRLPRSVTTCATVGSHFAAAALPAFARHFVVYAVAHGYVTAVRCTPVTVWLFTCGYTFCATFYVACIPATRLVYLTGFACRSIRFVPVYAPLPLHRCTLHTALRFCPVTIPHLPPHCPFYVHTRLHVRVTRLGYGSIRFCRAFYVPVLYVLQVLRFAFSFSAGSDSLPRIYLVVRGSCVARAVVGSAFALVTVVTTCTPAVLTYRLLPVGYYGYLRYHLHVYLRLRHDLPVTGCCTRLPRLRFLYTRSVHRRLHLLHTPHTTRFVPLRTGCMVCGLRFGCIPQFQFRFSQFYSSLQFIRFVTPVTVGSYYLLVSS